MHGRGCFITFVQEGRSRTSGKYGVGKFVRAVGAAKPKGGFGCEVWVSEDRPYASAGMAKFCVGPDNIAIVHDDPRRLGVMITTGMRGCLPCRGTLHVG